MMYNVLGPTHPLNQLNKQYSMEEVFVDFVSQVNGIAAVTNQHDKFLDELDACGESLTGGTMILPGNAKLNLRPLTNFDAVLQNYEIIELQNVSWHAIHVKSLHAATQQAIDDSLNTDNWAYNQARMMYGTMPNWYPNFFRPIFKVNGVDIYTGLAQSNYLTGGVVTHQADLSMGKQLPFYDLLSKWWDEPINSIEVNAGAFQIVEVAGVRRFQRYPVYCSAQFVCYSSK